MPTLWHTATDRAPSDWPLCSGSGYGRSSSHQGGRAIRIGLVLGGGGVIGSAYLTGALEAIRRVTGWEPRGADVVVGTSAGSVVGALQAAGLPPWLMHYRATDDLAADVEIDRELLEATAQEGRRPDREWLTRLYPGTSTVPRLAFSSPRMVARGLATPWRTNLAMFLTGLWMEGFVSTETIGEMIRIVVPDGWIDNEFWAVSVDLDTGRRMPYGRADMPATDMYRAVRASCAIPGFFAPVRINGHRHVDGGVWSASNLDLVADRGLDLALVINPMSTLEGRSFEGPVDRITGTIHRLEGRVRFRIGRRLGRERREVERAGTPVYIVQPTTADLDVMPPNLMNPGNRRAATAMATETTMRTLETDPDARETVAILEKAAEDIGPSGIEDFLRSRRSQS